MRLAAGRRAKNCLRPSPGAKLLGGVRGRGVYVVLRSQLAGQRFLVFSAGEDDGPEAELRGVLHGKVPQPAEAVNRHQVSASSRRTL